jgi:hypothetical protein
VRCQCRWREKSDEEAKKKQITGWMKKATLCSQERHFNSRGLQRQPFDVPLLPVNNADAQIYYNALLLAPVVTYVPVIPAVKISPAFLARVNLF